MAAGVVSLVIGQKGTSMVPLVAVAMDKPTVEAEVAAAAEGGVKAVDTGSKTAILASSYLMIPCLPYPLRRTTLVPHTY